MPAIQEEKNMIRSILLLFIILDLIFVGLELGLSVKMFFYPASTFLVVGGVLVLLYLSFPLSEILQAAGFIFSPKREISKKRYLLLSCIYKAMGEYFLFTGVIGSYIGFYLILSSLQDFSTLGPKSAVSLITIFYGIIGKLLSVLLQRKLGMCVISEEEYKLSRPRPVLSFIVASIAFLLLIVTGILSGGTFNRLTGFFDPTSLILVVVCSVLVALLFSPPKVVRGFFKLVFTPSDISLEKAGMALRLFNQFRDSVISMVIIASIAALVYTVNSNLEPSQLGPRLAIMILSLFWGIIFVSLIQGLNYTLQRKLVETGREIEVKPLFSDYFIIIYSIVISVLIWSLLMSVPILRPDFLTK